MGGGQEDLTLPLPLALTPAFLSLLLNPRPKNEKGSVCSEKCFLSPRFLLVTIVGYDDRQPSVES